MPCGLFFSKHQNDDAIFKTVWLKCWMVVLGLFLLIFPLYGQQVSDAFGFNTLNLFNLIFIYIVGAHGLNLLTGYTGQISLGHGAFMGVGAYTAGILANLGVPFWLCLPLAGLMTAAVGMIFGIPSLRLKGLYLAIATMAAQFIIVYAMRNWTSLTGGSAGLGVPSAELFGFVFDTDFSFYYLSLTFAAAATIYLKNITRTRTGRAFVAVRDRYLAAEVIGVNLFKYRIMSFGISSFMVGIAGGLWAYYITIISDEHFTILLSIRYLAMIIVGGLGSVLGAVFGAVFMTMVPELLKDAISLFQSIDPNAMAYLSPLQTVVFGLLIVVFLVFEPLGLVEMWRRVKDYFRLWPFEH